eukprot:CAMPEP_0170528466 /NCGR_PEP_ID=MMETSP0209-20121228/13968_1 /TAXON_ID=665100 ORGANISM="Litonotus pictus, Strain P1" /NCGR_SAMPLE_ID=MMETSP0209 /ASSEMBLY_ACC=CAM_ASM_000301 /LENGTH=1305 /DNA_ID=CAMNT_0010819695 /DNA_START=483 /DNA_END=4397 /DNA_ORIENTATION=-
MQDNSIIRNTIIKTFQDRIFWTPEQIQDMKNKLKEGCKKIILQKQLDFSEIENNIKIHSEQSYRDLKEKLTDPIFKNFYHKEMRSSDLLDSMLKEGLGKLVRELIDSDPEYFVFDYNLIINLFEENLQDSGLNELSNNTLQNFLGNAIKYDLYPKPTTYLLAYLASIYSFYDEFREIIHKEQECFEEDLAIFNYFESEQDIRNFSNSRETFNIVIGYCLKNDWEKIAIVLYQTKQEEIDPEIIKISITSYKLNFLQYLWESWNKKVSENLNQSKWVFPIKAKISATEVLDDQLMNLSRINPSIIFLISELMVEFTNLKSEKSVMNTIINKWDYLEHDRKLLEVLFDLKLYDEISLLIQREKFKHWAFKKEHFEKVIKNLQLNLICFFIEKTPHLTDVLNNSKIQEIIVLKYMKQGNKIYYGTEMLANIYKNNWSQDMTKELCKSILKTIKTKDILNCHSPILTCVLLSEFLNNIGSNSVLHSSRIERVVKELLQFCENIQNSTNDETYIKFLMNQKSIHGRTAFQITSENDFYQCLNNPNIGTLVGKMWNGEISHNGLFKASCLKRYLESNKSKQTDPFLEFEPMEASKSYFFQLGVWENSCSLRYWPESLFTILLIINYNIFIYLLTLDGRYKGDWKTIYDDDGTVKVFYILYLTQVICININTIIQTVFGFMTKRRIKILTAWNFLELIMLILALSLNLNFHSEEDKKIGIHHNMTSSNIETTLLCLNDVVVWLRIAGILLTFKNLGPVIRMVYLMAFLLLKYILIYSLFIVCMSAVFTSIFFGSSDAYMDFSSSLVSLMTPFVNWFDTNSFRQNDLFGKIMVMIYTFLTAVLLINLLIAVLSSVYDELSKLVDASHRAVLINYYQKYQWDSKFGYLILLPNTMSVLNLVVFPIQWFMGSMDEEKQESFNKIVCKVYFLIFYYPFIFLAFGVYSLLLLPLCYLKCLLTVIKLQFSFKGSQLIKIFILFKTLLFGMIILLYYYFRDLFLLTKNMFIESRIQQTNLERIKSFISKEDIVVFLEFIHGRTKKDENTLNSIFIDYLAYEQMKKIQSDFKIKAKADYVEKLKMQLQKNQNASTIMFNPTMNPGKSNKRSKTNGSSGGEEEDEYSAKSFIKKNLIIIEILENFLIEDDNEEYHVDIEKLKLLLPKGLEINDDYIQRLVHTDISSINKAVNKLKTNKNVLLQYQLINKIMNHAIKIDKDIDYEIHKNLLVKRSEKKESQQIESTKGYEKMKDIMKCISDFSKIKMEKREKKLLREKKKSVQSMSKKGTLDPNATLKDSTSDSRTQTLFKRKQTLAKHFGI